MSMVTVDLVIGTAAGAVSVIAVGLLVWFVWPESKKAAKSVVKNTIAQAPELSKAEIEKQLSSLTGDAEGAATREQSLRILAVDIVENEKKLMLIREYVDRAAKELEWANRPFGGGFWIVFHADSARANAICSLDELQVSELWATGDVAVYQNAVLEFAQVRGWVDVRTGEKALFNQP